MKLNLNEQIGTEYSMMLQLIKKIQSADSVLMGWVDSYNESSNTVNVQPAIQTKTVNSDNIINYVNKPLLINCWVMLNTMTRKPQKGDKCLILILDEKSNNFFKAIYDSTKNLSDQTIVNTSSSYKDINNCVAIIYNPAFIEPNPNVIDGFTSLSTTDASSVANTTKLKTNAQNIYNFDNGAAIGNGAISGAGFAGGYNAKTIDVSENPIDAIQLGTGTNNTANALQVYSYLLMAANGNIPAERLGNIIYSSDFVGTDGYIKFLNGFTIEWGYTTSQTITFPIAFDNACLYVGINYVDSGTSNVLGTQIGANYSNITTTGFKINGSNSEKRLWLAIGH